MKTHAELVAIARAHAEAEGRSDLATTLATLERCARRTARPSAIP